MAKSVMVMAGGTGGHVYPALAVAQELRDRGWQVSWLGTPDSFESRVVPGYGFELDIIPAHRLRGQGLKALALAPVRLLRAMFAASKVMRQRQPSVVLGFGGFVTGPGGLVSKMLRLPLVIHEQNSIPGLTNRWLSKVASSVLEGFPASFPDQVQARHTGNPVRPEIISVEQPSMRFDQRVGAIRVLVVGGSLGAQALNELVPQALASIQPRVLEVRHQAGRNHAQSTLARYQRLGVQADVTEFIQDMAQAYSWADLIICRSGALTVAELSAVGLAAILVPFPHAVDDHQATNAGYLVDAGAAVMIRQSELTPSVLAQHIQDLTQDRGRLLAMAQAGRALAKPQATGAVASACEEVIQHD